MKNIGHYKRNKHKLIKDVIIYKFMKAATAMMAPAAKMPKTSTRPAAPVYAGGATGTVPLPYVAGGV